MPPDPGRQFPGTPRTALDQWFDSMVRHQIGLLRRSASIRNQILKLLDDTEADLRIAIRERLRRYTGTQRPADVARLENLLVEVRALRQTAWSQVSAVWFAEMAEIAIAEPKFMAALLQTVVPVQLTPTLPTAAQMRSLVTSRPFEGRTLREWAEQVSRGDVERIQGQIRIGLVQGEDLPTITRRVTGTISLKGRNGVTEITRRHAEAITRTAVNHYANQARRAFAEENAEFFDRELYVATLDSKTTPICRSLDGELFPIGEGPIPPLHFRCRSLRTPAPDPEAIGKRPMKPVTERQLLREFAAMEGLEKVPRQRASLPRGTKGAFDEFARVRTRELIGRVPAKTTYQRFLERQPVWFQNDVLGETRGLLFRKGGLTLKDFVDRGTFEEFTLAELADMHARAFRDAGLDPADFLLR